MNIVLFTHPDFSGTYSISLYTKMIAEGMRQRNHKVEICTAEGILYRLPLSGLLKKWLGYIDQFLIFPVKFKRRLRRYPSDTLFVFADHALGPWIPLVADRPHLIHCHDFLAQRSALDEFPDNKISVSGKIYQNLIRNGYRCGRNFISISKNTQRDLHKFLKTPPSISEVIYNGLNQKFGRRNKEEASKILVEALDLPLSRGFILHVGGGQFYKNRKGVIEIYNAWRNLSGNQLPLLMIGAAAEGETESVFEASPYTSDIYFTTGISDKLLRTAYQAADVFLFPSLDEGFGWPIAEAMASGCAVITTNRAPMNEVGSSACMYIDRRPANAEAAELWAIESAKTLEKFFQMSDQDREKLILSGLKNSERFNTERAIDNIERIYKRVLLNKPSDEHQEPSQVPEKSQVSGILEI